MQRFWQIGAKSLNGKATRGVRFATSHIPSFQALRVALRTKFTSSEGKTKLTTILLKFKFTMWKKIAGKSWRHGFQRSRVNLIRFTFRRRKRFWYSEGSLASSTHTICSRWAFTITGNSLFLKGKKYTRRLCCTTTKCTLSTLARKASLTVWSSRRGALAKRKLDSV